MPDNEIRNRIVTEFTQSGDREALAITQRLEEHTNGLTEQTARLVTVTEAWESALRDATRQSQFGAIISDLTKAVQSGENLNKVLADTRQRLTDIGATENEVRAAVNAALSAGGANRGAALQQFGREARLALPAIPIPGTTLSSESIARVVEISGRLNLRMKDLAVGGGLAAGALVAVVIAFKTFQTTIDAVSKQLSSITQGVCWRPHLLKR